MTPPAPANPWFPRLEKTAFVLAALLTLYAINAFWNSSTQIADANKLVDSVRVVTPQKTTANTEDNSSPKTVTPGKQPTVAQSKPKGPPSRSSKPATPPSIHDTLASQISQRNMFTVKRNPTLTGVLGDKAYFSDGQSAAPGGSVSMGKILAVGADWAEIEIDGKPQKMNIFGSKLPPSAPSSSAPSRSIRPTSAKQTLLNAKSSGGRPAGMSAYQYLKSMAPGEMKNYYNNLSPEEKKQVGLEKAKEYGASKSGGKSGGKSDVRSK